MKMIVCVMALILLFAPVFAVNVTSEDETDEKLTDVDDEVDALPGDFTYGFQRFFENFDLFFTFDKTEKAKKNARYGKLRALEAHKMVEKAEDLEARGKADEAKQALSEAGKLAREHNARIEEAQDNLEQALEEDGPDEQEIEEVESELHKSIAVLQRVYADAPEPAKEGLQRALNNTIRNQERHEEKVSEKSRERENRRNDDESEGESGEEESLNTREQERGRPDGSGDEESGPEREQSEEKGQNSGVAPEESNQEGFQGKELGENTSNNFNSGERKNPGRIK